jgi:wyosine [tRNA(Phe)-imidazoG37] synthetase (radical SAM superfamily)
MKNRMRRAVAKLAGTKVADLSKYLYGPVPSRRLGLSLGVDIIPFKTCTLDCIYCQLGKTTCKTLQRKEYVPINDVLAELKTSLDASLHADYITISGSGEPTLHSGLGQLVEGIKKLTAIPVAVLTNGTLFYMPAVRADCTAADVILPSLDAGDQQTFNAINRPHPEVTFDRMIEGLCDLRREYPGRIWLEVFCIERFNTDSPQITKLAEAIKRIRPDKIHLNTAVRPTAEPGVQKVTAQKLDQIARRLGPNCEVIVDYLPSHCGKATDNIEQSLLSMLKRRPCSLKDIHNALGLHPNDAIKYLGKLEKQGIIRSENKQGHTFFRIN